MIIFLAALQGVPEHLYEAAEIDGAGRWAKIRHVTVPQLTPTIFLLTVLNIIGSFQVFTDAFIITEGGPAGATLVYLLHLYRKAFRSFHMGYGAAMGWFLFMIVLILTMIQLWLSRRCPGGRWAAARWRPPPRQTSRWANPLAFATERPWCGNARAG